ncbi:ABC transporter [bacterium SCGC AG-212-C10]|nr:ABC transporter [bacterium SCGC AG-212-C10]
MYENTKTPAAGITAEGLGKRYGDLWALRDFDLTVPTGSVLGLLGHNGAGKTTVVRILATLSQPTTGRATVAGHDVVNDAAAVRASIGLAGQAATVDGLLSARANLELVGRLYRFSRADSKRRAAELLERLDLVDAADRLVRTFSGGMRRRLDLAATMVAAPPVLFLDEPTTGLDPRSRADLWELLRSLVRDGTTVILTTQYLEEADQLSDRIVVLDHGGTVAEGTPAELKAKVGGERLRITVSDANQLHAVGGALHAFASGSAVIDHATLSATIPVEVDANLMHVVRALDGAGIAATNIERREATLDDVFFALTERQPVTEDVA